MLEISPATGAVRVIGKLSTKDSPVNKNWKWMWHGAAEGPDGIIYGIPSNADAVLRVDPVTREVTTFGAEDIPPGAEQVVRRHPGTGRMRLRRAVHREPRPEDRPEEAERGDAG